MPHEPLLAALEAITALRSLETVEAALLKTIGEIYPQINHLYLLTWHDQELIEYGALLHGQFAEHSGQSLASDHPLYPLRSLLSFDPQREPGVCGEYFVYPLRRLDRLHPAHALLVLHIDSLPSNAREVIASLIRIVENFTELLREKNRDRLTGLLNRHQLEEGIHQLLNRSTQHSNGQYWLAMMDIDHFKQINDTLGHLFGDEVLLTVSQLMQGAFRNQDQLFRYGGEEFVVLLNDVDEAGALGALERFRCDVERYRFPQLSSVTLSIGYCQLLHQGNAASALGQADQALYQAKHQGRNQVLGYHQLSSSQSAVQQIGSIDLF